MFLGLTGRVWGEMPAGGRGIPLGGGGGGRLHGTRAHIRGTLLRDHDPGTKGPLGV